MILYSANLVVPAAVRHSTDNLDGYFLCTAVYVSQPQEAYTHFYYQSPLLGEVAAAATLGFGKVACACFILITLAGPSLLCLERSEKRGGGEVAQSLLMVSHTAMEGSHLLCPLTAFHTASVPVWSMTPEPKTTSSLPPHTHTAKAAQY